MRDLLQEGIIAAVLGTGIRLAAPFLLAGIGELFSQRSGVYNLGVEGVMMLGAFTAFIVAWSVGLLYLAVVAAVLVGVLMGLIMAFISVTLEGEQGITGIGLYMFGWGLSGLLFRRYVGFITSVQGFGPLKVAGLSSFPLVGPIFFHHNWFVYLSLLMVALSAVVLNRTPWGLNVRAVGMKPEAADSLGVSVSRVRYQCVVLGSALAALAGAAISLGEANMYADNITAGRGFIAVALVYFARWNPWGMLAGSLLFGMVTSLQLWIQVLGIRFPYEVAVILPYLATIVALAGVSRRVWAPAALGKPFRRGA